MRQVSSTRRLGPWPRTEQPKDAGPRPPEAYAVVRRGWARAEDAGMRRSSATALDEPLFLPLAEDPLAGRLRLVQGLLGRGRTAGRLREHDVQDPGVVDLVDGRVG